ncbi:MAG: hypothetical protein MJE66_14125 [Proteobacteria bacterium]|nr:hypothetical protein [Pseudomonadota bacterium]
MADAIAFDFTCQQLEERTSLDRLEARGTVRLALKQAGLEVRTVTPDQMGVVLERVLPAELQARGVDGHESVCAEIGRGLTELSVEADGDSPEAVFERLGGR